MLQSFRLASRTTWLWGVEHIFAEIFVFTITGLKTNLLTVNDRFKSLQTNGTEECLRKLFILWGLLALSDRFEMRLEQCCMIRADLAVSFPLFIFSWPLHNGVPCVSIFLSYFWVVSLDTRQSCRKRLPHLPMHVEPKHSGDISSLCSTS